MKNFIYLQQHNISKMENTLNVKCEFCFEFTSFNHWVNKANVLYKQYRLNHFTTFITIDSTGVVMVCGLDFSTAEKNNTYPLKVYRLTSYSSNPYSKENETKN